MSTDPHSNSKVTAEHLGRRAFLYVRQSTLRQVLENTESTQRQYALRDRAAALGWSQELITVIDGDTGQSGASSTAREGFQHLVAEVGMGHAGIVMGIEVSRLARNNADWHRLLEICAVTQTLILDEDGIYDPTHFNDRLVLGLKGTMSEAELHVLRARLRGGILSQARRGALKMRLPTGLVRDPLGRAVLDPDKEVQESFRLLFEVFTRTGSCHATARYWREQQLRFPRRIHSGPQRGEIVWTSLGAGRIGEIVRNPCYAGAFVYGRRRDVRRPNGKHRQVQRARADWIALHADAHPGYITWAQYESNLAQLQANAEATGATRRAPPREGPALLQGLVVCGRCGQRMTVRYRQHRDLLAPEYVCMGHARKGAAATCQSIPGTIIDRMIGDLLLASVTPMAVDVSVSVQRELQQHLDETDRLRYRQVERAEQEAGLARQRYMAVHPDNRMVADTLEADWNDKLKAHAEARASYEQQREADRSTWCEQQLARISALAQNFPAIWTSPATTDRDRKRMARLLIEDVTLVKGEQTTVHVRFPGGATRSLTVPRALAAWETWVTPPVIVARIDELIEEHTDREIAAILNSEGHASGQGHMFSADRVKKIRRSHALKDRLTRLRRRGWLTLAEISDRLGLSAYTVKARRAKGTLPVRSIRLDDTGAHLYEDLERAAPPIDLPTARTEEVQYGT